MSEIESPDESELLRGDLARIPLAEVLQMLQLQQQTGVLRIMRKSHSMSVTMAIKGGTEFWVSR